MSPLPLFRLFVACVSPQSLLAVMQLMVCWLGCSGKAEKQQHAQLEEELNTGGKIWLGCAAAAVTAFCLFSGQYVTIGAYEYDDDDEDNSEGL